MCLMCEWYFDSCYNDECYDAAVNPEEKYITNYKVNPRKVFLHKGYTGPCQHMIDNHGPECCVIKRHDSEYGMIYDSCNCYEDEDGWTYD